MSSPNTVDAYILIGGRSHRLGRDKASALLGGATLAQRAYRTVSEALPASRIAFVAGYETQFAIEAIAAGGRFIFDLITDRGPLGGLHAALADAQTPWIFVLACDYPFVTLDLVRSIAKQISNDHGAAVPMQQDGRLQPLCAFYKVQMARPLVQQIIDRPRVPPPLHEVVADLNPRIVESAEFADLAASDAFFININTADDLGLALEIERKLSAKK
jgi:molybdopterin-guanine dinucleotide biosynthesis protein A